jgi:hypothetical protein
MADTQVTALNDRDNLHPSCPLCHTDAGDNRPGGHDKSCPARNRRHG